MPNKFYFQSTVLFTATALTLGISAASHVGTAALGLYSCHGNLDTKPSAIASLQRCQNKTGANLDSSFSLFKPGEELTDPQLKQIREALNDAGFEFFRAKRQLIWPWPIDQTGALWLIVASAVCSLIAVGSLNLAYQVCED